MTRAKLIEGLMWITEWGLFRDPKDQHRMRLTVAVGLPSSKYTNDELARLLEFSIRHTAAYDGFFGENSHDGQCNYITIDKIDDGRVWKRKRRTWEIYNNSPTLDDAIATFSKELESLEATVARHREKRT
jgi:hypothetical protein